MPQDQIEARKRERTAPLLRVAGGAALTAVIICAGSSMASAGDDTMSSGTSITDKVLEVIGVGGGSDIQYGERSPLVVPPTRDLPPPVADHPPAVADWPKDPDFALQRRAKAKEKPRPHRDYVIESSRPLSPSELNVPGPIPGMGGSRPSNADPDADPTTPAVANAGKKSLFSFDFLNPNKTEYATFTGEPTRTSLTEPPPGYLTPSPDQPYGVGPERKQYKIPTVADRVTPQSGSSGGN